MTDSLDTVFREIVEEFNSIDSDKAKIEKKLSDIFDLDPRIPYKRQIEAKLGRSLNTEEGFVAKILELQRNKAIKNRGR